MYMYMEKLKKLSILVYDGMVIVNPDNFSERKLTGVKELKMRFSKNFTYQDLTLCFVLGDEVFVTAATGEKVKFLASQGFTFEEFEIPFTTSEYPKDEKKRWNDIKILANNDRVREYLDSLPTKSYGPVINESGKVDMRMHSASAQGEVKLSHFFELVMLACADVIDIKENDL